MAKMKFTMEGDLPEALKGVAAPAEEGEGFELDIDKLGDLSKLDDFRSNNRTLHNEKTKLEKDLAAAQQAIADLEAKIDTSNKGKKDLDDEKKTLEQRLQALEDSNKAKDADIQQKNMKLARQNIRRSLSKALADAGVKATAMEDALEVGIRDWQVEGDPEEGAVRLYHGENVVLSPDRAGEPITPEEWAGGWLKSRTHFLADSQGDGGRDGDVRRVNGKIQVKKTDAVAMGLYAEDLNSGKAELVD